jgi:hypothetical protein
MLKRVPMTLETLRRFCRQEAKAARAQIRVRPSGKLVSKPFDNGYYLGLAHAYELLLKHKLRKR